MERPIEQTSQLENIIVPDIEGKDVSVRGRQPKETTVLIINGRNIPVKDLTIADI